VLLLLVLLLRKTQQLSLAIGPAPHHISWQEVLHCLQHLQQQQQRIVSTTDTADAFRRLKVHLTSADDTLN
jgi:hypothetical protein